MAAAIFAPKYLVRASRSFSISTSFSGLLAAEQVRDQRDLGEVLDGFHLHVGVFERVAVGHDAVVRHEDRVVGWNIGLESLGQFRRAGRAVAGQAECIPGP